MLSEGITGLENIEKQTQSSGYEEVDDKLRSAHFCVLGRAVKSFDRMA